MQICAYFLSSSLLFFSSFFFLLLLLLGDGNLDGREALDRDAVDLVDSAVRREM